MKNAASTARWVQQSFLAVQRAVEGNNLSLKDFVALDTQGPLALSTRVLSKLKVSEFEDPILATAIFNLQGTMIVVAERRAAQLEVVTRASSLIVAEGWFTAGRRRCLQQGRVGRAAGGQALRAGGPA